MRLNPKLASSNRRSDLKNDGLQTSPALLALVGYDSDDIVDDNPDSETYGEGELTFQEFCEININPYLEDLLGEIHPQDWDDFVDVENEEAEVVFYFAGSPVYIRRRGNELLGYLNEEIYLGMFLIPENPGDQEAVDSIGHLDREGLDSYEWMKKLRRMGFPDEVFSGVIATAQRTIEHSVVIAFENQNSEVFSALERKSELESEIKALREKILELEAELPTAEETTFDYYGVFSSSAPHINRYKNITGELFTRSHVCKWVREYSGRRINHE